MTREEKENLLREAVDLLIKLDNHLMTTRDNAEFSQWVEDLIESYCEEREQGRKLEQIRAEIDRQEKWLLQAGYTAYNVDIAFDSIKSVLAESEAK